MDATSGRHAALMTDGRRRALARALFAVALATGLLAATAGSAAAATCTGAGAVQNRSFTLTHTDGTIPAVETNVADITGRVHQGDAIVASFEISSGCSDVRVTLISYYAPGPTFDRSQAYRQTAANSDSALFSAGTHTDALRITVPKCYFQADLVQGDPIGTFGYGTTGQGFPSNGQGFYSDQGRLVDAANGGTNACPPGTILPPITT
jgi:hypothetical protein